MSGLQLTDRIIKADRPGEAPRDPDSPHGNRVAPSDFSAAEGEAWLTMFPSSAPVAGNGAGMSESSRAAIAVVGAVKVSEAGE